jgi:hypothetical protein
LDTNQTVVWCRTGLGPEPDFDTNVVASVRKSDLAAILMARSFELAHGKPAADSEEL